MPFGISQKIPGDHPRYPKRSGINFDIPKNSWDQLGIIRGSRPVSPLDLGITFLNIFRLFVGLSPGALRIAAFHTVMT
jgi:hypothetical protein